MPKKTLFMHIGAPKTGTSAFQTYCAKNADILLEKHGLLYPDLSGNFQTAASNKTTSGNGLFIASTFLAENDYTIDSAEEGHKQLNNAMNLLRDHPCRKLLISSEDLFLLSAKDFLILSERCKEVDARLHLICAVRDLVPWLASTYGQQVKQHGRTDSFEHCATKLTISLDKPVNLSKAAAETDAFSLTVLNYGDIKHSVAHSLLEHLDVDHFETLPEIENTFVNRSLSALELALMRSANAALDLRPPNEGALVSEALINSDPQRQAAKLQLSEKAANRVWEKTQRQCRSHQQYHFRNTHRTGSTQ